MATQLTTIYCLCDDLLRTLQHREDRQRKMSDAEVMTTALAAARLFRGNFAAARLFLRSYGYIPQMLSKGTFSRRLHRLSGRFRLLFEVLGEAFKARAGAGLYLVDSFPVPACDNIRIPVCRLYPSRQTRDAYRGYTASKRRFFYGLKLHLLVTQDGLPVEAFLTPGSHSDTAELRRFAFDLPEGATVYGDKAYNDYLTEDLLGEAARVTALAAEEEELETRRSSLRRVRAALLPQAGRDRGQPGRAALAQVDPCDLG